MYMLGTELLIWYLVSKNIAALIHFCAYEFIAENGLKFNLALIRGATEAKQLNPGILDR
jgi:hypothetical protein